MVEFIASYKVIDTFAMHYTIHYVYLGIPDTYLYTFVYNESLLMGEVLSSIKLIARNVLQR